MVPDSINIPLENIRFSQIPFDKTDKIVLYSRTSSGAYMAYRYLVSKGYVNLFVLEGGASSGADNTVAKNVVHTCITGS